MYVPAAFKEERIEVLQDLIRAHPLGLLISTGPEGPMATPMPFYFVAGSGTLGSLEGHLARANTHWKTLHDQDVLVVFQGTNAYISPSWYQSKMEHGKVVPTWNYTMVQVRGLLTVIEDNDWLKRQITHLTNRQEGQRPHPWALHDAPERFIHSQIKGIVGVGIAVRQIEGKWKVSQNRPIGDRLTVAEGLSSEGNDAMAKLVSQYGGIADQDK
jgi:transcriptional regulator